MPISNQTLCKTGVCRASITCILAPVIFSGRVIELWSPLTIKSGIWNMTSECLYFFQQLNFLTLTFIHVLDVQWFCTVACCPWKYPISVSTFVAVVELPYYTFILVDRSIKSSWKYCDWYRWANPDCAKLWCSLTFPSTSDPHQRKNKQG